MDSNLLFILFVFVCGSCFGSFLYCLALRIVRKEDWIKGRSRCPNCGHILGFCDLIPIVSWLYLKGKCRYCKNRIPASCLFSELFMGSVFVLTCLKTISDPVSTISFLVLFSLFFCLSVVDLKSYIIPDVFIALGIINRVVSVFIQGNVQNGLMVFYSAVLIAFTVIVSALITNTISRRECVGGGDIKLIFTVCLYTGFYKCLVVLLLSSLIGILIVLMTRKRKIPFGPCICLSAAAVILYGDQLIKYLFL